jgi:hypothetical protein
MARRDPGIFVLFLVTSASDTPPAGANLKCDVGNDEDSLFNRIQLKDIYDLQCALFSSGSTNSTRTTEHDNEHTHDDPSHLLI